MLSVLLFSSICAALAIPSSTAQGSPSPPDSTITTNIPGDGSLVVRQTEPQTFTIPLTIVSEASPLPFDSPTGMMNITLDEGMPNNRTIWYNPDGGQQFTGGEPFQDVIPSLTWGNSTGGWGDLGPYLSGNPGSSQVIDGAVTINYNATIYAMPLNIGFHTLKVKWLGFSSPQYSFDVVSSGGGWGSEKTFSIGGPDHFMLAPGDSISETYYVSSINDFAGTVTLRFNGPLTGSFTGGYLDGVIQKKNATLTAGATVDVTLNLAVDSMKPGGSYTCFIDGQSLSAQHSNDPPTDIHHTFQIQAQVSSGGGPMLTISPPAISPGSMVTFYASGFTPSDAVTLRWASYVNYNEMNLDGTEMVPQTYGGGANVVDSTGSWSASGNVPGDFPGGMFWIRATDEHGVQAETGFNVGSGGADFVVNISPEYVSIAPGGANQTVDFSITSMANFSGTVTLTLPSYLPYGVSATWLKDGTYYGSTTHDMAVTADQTTSPVTIDIKADSHASGGNTFIPIDADYNSGEIHRVQDFELFVRPPSGFGPSFMVTPGGGMANDTINIQGFGFSAADGTSVTITEKMSGQAITTSPTSITLSGGQFVGSFSVPSASHPLATPGNYELMATAGSESAFAWLDVFGASSTFDMSVNPPDVHLNPNDSTSVQVIVSSRGGQDPTVNLETFGISSWAGINAVFQQSTLNVPSGGDNSTTLTITTSANTPSGMYDFEIRATNAADSTELKSVWFGLMVVEDSSVWGGMAAEMNINPSYGSPGDTVTVTGYNFPADSPITLEYAGTSITLPGGTSTDSSGSLGTIIFTIPSTGSGSGPGTWPVDVSVAGVWRYMPFDIVGSGQSFMVELSDDRLVASPGESREIQVRVIAVGAMAQPVRIHAELVNVPSGITAGFPPAYALTPDWEADLTSPGQVVTNTLIVNFGEAVMAGNYFVDLNIYDVNDPSVWVGRGISLDVMGGFGDWGAEHGYMGANLALSSTSGKVNNTITFNGYAFPPDSPVTTITFGGVDINNTGQSIPAITSDSNGDFTGMFTVPSGMSGTQPFAITCGGVMREIPFTIVSATDKFTLTVSPSELPPTSSGSYVKTTVAIAAQTAATEDFDVELRIRGLYTAMGSFTHNWTYPNGTSVLGEQITVPVGVGKTVSLSLRLDISDSVPTGPYMFEVQGWIDTLYHFPPYDLDPGEESHNCFVDMYVQPSQDFVGGDFYDYFDTSEGMQDASTYGWDANDMYFPYIVLSPTSGQPGAIVTVSGYNFPAGVNITNLFISGISQPIPAKNATSDGSFTLIFAIPSNLPGTYGRFEVHVDANSYPGQAIHPWGGAAFGDITVLDSSATFSAEVSPDRLPPIMGGTSETTLVTVKALGSTTQNVRLQLDWPMDSAPPGLTVSWGGAQVAYFDISVPGNGINSTSLTLTVATSGYNPGFCWPDILCTTGGEQLRIPFEFEIMGNHEFMDDTFRDQFATGGDQYTMATQYGWDNKAFFFPEMTLSPSTAKAGERVEITLMNFPPNMAITSLMVAGNPRPIASGLTTDSSGSRSGITFIVPDNLPSGMHPVDVFVENSPPAFGSLNVISTDATFIIEGPTEPLHPPIPYGGSTTTPITVFSQGNATYVHLHVDMLPPGINAQFSGNIGPQNTLYIPAGGKNSTNLIISVSPGTPPMHYCVDVAGDKYIGTPVGEAHVWSDGTSTGIAPQVEQFRTMVNFDVEPPQDFMSTTFIDSMTAMADQYGWGKTDYYHPTLTLSPNHGKAGATINYKLSDYLPNSNITEVWFGGQRLPVPADAQTDSSGSYSGVFNSPTTYSQGWYWVEVKAGTGMEQTMAGTDYEIISDSSLATINAAPNFLPPIAQDDYQEAAVTVTSLASATITVSLNIVPAHTTGRPGINATWLVTDAQQQTTAYDGSTTITVTPGSSKTIKLRIYAGANIGTGSYVAPPPPGHYVSDINVQVTDGTTAQTFMIPMDYDLQGFNTFVGGEFVDYFMTGDGATMTQDYGWDMKDMYFPSISLNPTTGKPGVTDIFVTGMNFPPNKTVQNIWFSGILRPIPSNLTTDANGEFTAQIKVPATLGQGHYSIDVQVEDAPWVTSNEPFIVMTAETAFYLDVNPNHPPTLAPISPGSYADVKVTVHSDSSGNRTVHLHVDGLPPDVTASWWYPDATSGTNQGATFEVDVQPGGENVTTLRLTVAQSSPPGFYHCEVAGDNYTQGQPRPDQAQFRSPLDFDVPPSGDFIGGEFVDYFMTGDGATMTQDYGWGRMDFYFPKLTISPTSAKAGSKVTITGHYFPPNQPVESVWVSGIPRPMPATAPTTDANGDLNLQITLPDNLHPGMCEIEVLVATSPPAFHPFEVIGADASFKLATDFMWMPPISPGGNQSTGVDVTSLKNGTINVNMRLDGLPYGVTASWNVTDPQGNTVTFDNTCVVTVSNGFTNSTDLTINVASHVPSGPYHADIVATYGTEMMRLPLEFGVEPPHKFMDTTFMTTHGVSFPEITIMEGWQGSANSTIHIKGTSFFAGATIEVLRIAGQQRPLPGGNVTADASGEFIITANVPHVSPGFYMVELEDTGLDTGTPPVFIAKPFSVIGSEPFMLQPIPSIPPVPQGSASNDIIVTVHGDDEQMAALNVSSIAVNLEVEGLPYGVTPSWSPGSTVVVTPGKSNSTTLTLTTDMSTPPGSYFGTAVKATYGSTTLREPVDFFMMPSAAFQMPSLKLDPDHTEAGEGLKDNYYITVSGSGFPSNQPIHSLKIAGHAVSLPAGVTTDSNGAFSGIPLSIKSAWNLNIGVYDVEVAVEDGFGGYMYKWAPFRIASATSTFDLAVSPDMVLPIPPGGSDSVMIIVKSVADSAAIVTLYVDGLPPGVTATFNPSNIVTALPHSTNSTTVTFDVSQSTSPGSCPLTIRGVSGTETIITPIAFGVMPFLATGQGFASINVNPPEGRPGDSVTILGSGFTAGENITLTIAPTGATTLTDITPLNSTGCPPIVSSDGTWSVTFNGTRTSSLNPGLYIVKATDGTRSAKVQYDIFPTSDQEFFLKLSPQFLQVAQGSTGDISFKVDSFNAFNSPVTFSVGSLPPGVTATVTNASGTTVGQFTGTPGAPKVVVAPIAQTPTPGRDLGVTVSISVDSNTPVGPYQVFLQAESGTKFRGIPLMLQVVPTTGVNMILTPVSGAADTDISITGSGFTADGNLTVTFAGQTVQTKYESVTGNLKQVESDGTFGLTITAPSLAAGIYPVNVTDTGGKSAVVPFGLTPSTTDTFILYASPPRVAIPKGGSGTITLTLKPVGTFGSMVNLAVTGLDTISGSSSSFSPASITPSIGTPTTSALTINIPADATVGNYVLTVTATEVGDPAEAESQTQKVAVLVVPAQGTVDFEIITAPSTLPILQGGSGTATITVISINDFSGAVALSITGLPSGVDISGASSITPSTATGMGKDIGTFTVAADVTPGLYTVTVTGTYDSGVGYGYGYGYGSQSIQHSTTLTLRVAPSVTSVTAYTPVSVDPTTITGQTPMTNDAPWGDVAKFVGLVSSVSEATTVEMSTSNVAPNTIGNYHSEDNISPVLNRTLTVEPTVPVVGVDWNLNFSYTETATGVVGGIPEQDLTIMYLNTTTEYWEIVPSYVDTANNVVYAADIDHFSDFSLGGSPGRPVAAVGGPYAGNEGSAIALDASSSTDSDGTISLYEWDWNSDGTYDESSASATTSHTWTDNGAFTVTLRITDNDSNTNTGTATVTVSNVAPTNVNAGSDQSVTTGSTVSFSGSFTDPGSSDTQTKSWNFGDGTSTSGTLTPTHSYSSAGTYTVTLTVTDDDSGVGSDTLTVTVSAAAEEPTPTAPSAAAPSIPTPTTEETAAELEAVTSAEAAEQLEEMGTEEAADVLEAMDTEKAADSLEAMDTATAAEVIEEATPTKAADILEKVETEKAAATVETMTTEKAADVIEKMDAETAANIVEKVEVTKAADVVEAMNAKAAADVVEKVEVEKAADIIAAMAVVKAGDVVENMVSTAAANVVVVMETSSAAAILDNTDPTAGAWVMDILVAGGNDETAVAIADVMGDDAAADLLAEMAFLPSSPDKAAVIVAGMDLVKATAVFETMAQRGNAKAAATIFNYLSTARLNSILEGLTATSVSAIVAELTPETRANVSSELIPIEPLTPIPTPSIPAEGPEARVATVEGDITELTVEIQEFREKISTAEKDVAKVTPKEGPQGPAGLKGELGAQGPAGPMGEPGVEGSAVPEEPAAAVSVMSYIAIAIVAIALVLSIVVRLHFTAEKAKEEDIVET